jgi:hypothetical protein
MHCRPVWLSALFRSSKTEWIAAGHRTTSDRRAEWLELAGVQTRLALIPQLGLWLIRSQIGLLSAHLGVRSTAYAGMTASAVSFTL